MFVPSIHHLSLLCIWLPSLALALRECDLDGATSTYTQGELIIPFDNLCGRDINAHLDYAPSAEQRRSDCLDRCVRQAPLCYGFDYSPYIRQSDNNCYLMNDSFPASSATERSFVADAGMLNPEYLARLPEDCKSLGLRGCFERYGPLGSFSTASSATPTASSSGGLSTGAKAGIGAGAGLVALIAILCGVLFILKRVKRKRSRSPSNTVQQSNHGGDTYPSHKAESQTHVCEAASGPELAEPSSSMPAASSEQVHEIDGRARHEK
jgi:hypothetical protein